jgi:hypothetical protein
MSQVLELDLGREVERRLEAQAGALRGLLALSERMLELASSTRLSAERLSELVVEGERFFGRLKQLEEGLMPLRERWVAENPGHERRQAVERAARAVEGLIRQLAGVHGDLQTKLTAARDEVAAEIDRLPRKPRRSRAARRPGRLLDCRG